MARFNANGAVWFADRYDKDNILEMYTMFDRPDWTWPELKKVLYFYRCPDCLSDTKSTKHHDGKYYCSCGNECKLVKYSPRWRWNGALYSR